jgi:hypothetical protein
MATEPQPRIFAEVLANPMNFLQQFWNRGSKQNRRSVAGNQNLRGGDFRHRVQSAEVSVFPQNFPIFCRKSKSSAENPKVPQNFSIFRRIRFNFCGTFGFSMEYFDLRSNFQIFRRSFSSSMELSIFPLNFSIFS